MYIKSTVKTVAAIALVGAGLLGSVGNAESEERVRWKMHAAWGKGLPHLGTSAPRYAESVHRLTGGNFVLKVFDPGALVPGNEGFDAVSKGAVDAAWSSAAYDVGKYPALAFFTSVPFGPSFGEYFAWKKYGGGDELQQEVYAKHNIKQLDCLALGPETSGWFKTEVASLDQLKGMKIRYLGLGARVLQKLGASTQLLSGGDIFPALEKGVIDAAEASMPSIDIKLGLHQVASFAYFPGWHQQVSISHLLVNMDKWNSLSDQYKAVLEVACGDSIYATFVETEFVNPKVLGELATKHGVNVKRWSDEELATFEQAWNDVVKEESVKDPLFKRIADSYFAFRDTYATWGGSQALKSTYLK